MSKHTPNMPHKYHQGKYTPTNPDKYIGDVTEIWFRSKWEYSFCVYCDNEDRIKKWSSEPENIKIYYDVIENSNHVTKTYIPDYYVEIDNNGEILKMVIEIKPYKDTIEPQEPKKQTMKSLENYEYRLKTYIKNILKWEAADKYCEKRGMTFSIITEKYFDNKQIKLF